MSTSAPTKKHVGLRFVTGARARSAVYVVRPAVPQRDPLTGRQQGIHAPLRAEFKEHVFHSGTAQRANRWSEEERQEVERYLINHPDFGRGDGTGIFLDKSTTLPQQIPDYLLDEQPEEIAVADKPLLNGPRCEWINDEGDETVQCEEAAADESGFCTKHIQILEAVDA